MYVYILTNKSGTLYVGVTNDIVRRMDEHKSKLVDGFAKKYNLNRLIYIEEIECKYDALSREKQIKGWRRSKKIKLIDSLNPHWKDLSLDLR